MPKINVKSIILYSQQGIRPDTLNRIIEARDGELIPVDPSELGKFLPLTIYMPDVERAKEGAGHPDGVRRKKAGRKKRAAKSSTQMPDREDLDMDASLEA